MTVVFHAIDLDANYNPLAGGLHFTYDTYIAMNNAVAFGAEPSLSAQRGGGKCEPGKCKQYRRPKLGPLA